MNAFNQSAAPWPTPSPPKGHRQAYIHLHSSIFIHNSSVIHPPFIQCSYEIHPDSVGSLFLQQCLYCPPAKSLRRECERERERRAALNCECRRMVCAWSEPSAPRFLFQDGKHLPLSLLFDSHFRLFRVRFEEDSRNWVCFLEFLRDLGFRTRGFSWGWIWRFYLFFCEMSVPWVF